MVSRRQTESEEPSRRSRPATTPEGRENQLVNLAVELAEKQLREGTASAQVISHYIKLGSTRETLEQERLRSENALLEAKIKALESAKDMQGLYANAIKAMRSYQGENVEDYDDDED
jgi:hypothetical protein